MKLELEINSNYKIPADTFTGPGKSKGYIMITPPIGSDSDWLFRVKLADGQSVVGFPKFGSVGVGFQREDDWNTNLPSTCETEEIYSHIKKNKDCKSRKSTCLNAIKLIQDAAVQLKSSKSN